MLIESMNLCAGADVRIERGVGRCGDVIAGRGARARVRWRAARAQARHHWVATATPANRESMISASVVASA